MLVAFRLPFEIFLTCSLWSLTDVTRRSSAMIPLTSVLAKAHWALVLGVSTYVFALFALTTSWVQNE